MLEDTYMIAFVQVSPAFGLFFLESELKLNECSKRKKLENLEEARSTKGTSSFS